MSFDIRAANRDDCSGIKDLTDQLGYPSAIEEVCERVELILKRDDHQIFVAEFNDILVGYMHLLSTIRISSERFVEIVSLIVEKSYQNQGIGKALVAEAEKWAKDRGFEYVRVRSDIVRDEAHDFYTRRGYEKIKTQKVFLKHIIDICGF